MVPAVCKGSHEGGRLAQPDTAIGCTTRQAGTGGHGDRPGRREVPAQRADAAGIVARTGQSIVRIWYTDWTEWTKRRPLLRSVPRSPLGLLGFSQRLTA